VANDASKKEDSESSILEIDDEDFFDQIDNDELSDLGNDDSGDDINSFFNESSDDDSWDDDENEKQNKHVPYSEGKNQNLSNIIKAIRPDGPADLSEQEEPINLEDEFVDVDELFNETSEENQKDLFFENKLPPKKEVPPLPPATSKHENIIDYSEQEETEQIDLSEEIEQPNTTESISTDIEELPLPEATESDDEEQTEAEHEEDTEEETLFSHENQLLTEETLNDSMDDIEEPILLDDDQEDDFDDTVYFEEKESNSPSSLLAIILAITAILTTVGIGSYAFVISQTLQELQNKVANQTVQAAPQSTLSQDQFLDTVEKVNTLSVRFTNLKEAITELAQESQSQKNHTKSSIETVNNNFSEEITLINQTLDSLQKQLDQKSIVQVNTEKRITANNNRKTSSNRRETISEKTRIAKTKQIPPAKTRSIVKNTSKTRSKEVKKPVKKTKIIRKIKEKNQTKTKAKIKGKWLVNLLSLSSKQAAERTQKKFSKLGIDTNQERTIINGRTWYRLQVRGFENKQDALDYSKEIKQSLKLAGPWVGRIKK
jgi:hypothetical protein